MNPEEQASSTHLRFEVVAGVPRPGSRRIASHLGRDRKRQIEVSPGPGSTLALTVVTVVTAAGMGQLFRGHSYLVPVVLVALVAHALCFGLRRARRFPPILVGPVCVLAVALVSTWLVFYRATALGIPDPHTWQVLTQALTQAKQDFASLRAPVPATTGFVWLSCLGIGCAGVLADTAAFRLGAPVEGVLPAFAVFLFSAGLGTSGGRSVAVALWIAAVLAWFLVIEVGVRTANVQWLTAQSADGTKGARSLLLVGGLLGLVAVLGAVLVGPAIPGATSGSLLSSATNPGNSTSQRTTISPLVNIKAELLSPSNATVFTVSSPAPSYWRLTSLDSFDGTTWSADATYQPVDGSLPSKPGPEYSSLVTQDFRITGLDETWLPAAFRPVALSGVSGAGYNQASASIIAGRPTYDGLSYTVTSEIPDFTAAELGSATVDTTADLALPSSLPSSIIELARRVTAGDRTAYSKALALQSYFRDNFTYSLDVPPSDSTNALVSFLFHTHKGYCQQFAGAYAVMARAVGLPSRVAVGFTPGQLGADGLYHVEALDAHAWPEVNLGAFGWVPFEPTPGRGEPGATGYTGVLPAQATAQNAAPSTSAPATSPSAARPAPVPAPSTPTRHAAPVPRRAPAAAGQGLGTLVILAYVLGALGGALALLALAAAAGRRRRWAAATSAPEAALAAFGEVSDLLSRAQRPRHPAETFVAYARRLGPSLADQAAIDLLVLADYAEAAAYAPWFAEDDPSDVRQLRELGERIARLVRSDMPRHSRILLWIDLRTPRSRPPEGDGPFLLRHPAPAAETAPAAVGRR